MKFWILALCAAAVVPFGTGCAEEQDDWREPVYPVGISTPPPTPAPPQTITAAPPAPPPAAPQAPESGDVVVGSDGDTQTPADGPSDQGPSEGPSDTDPSALTDFHAALDPYGRWVDDPTYGTVWVPSEAAVGADFVPYESAGHWTYDDDYVWASDYEWGWAPFHYGRWAYGRGVGWEWIPGRTYAGAWVSWRYGWDDWAYVGWAPLPPTWCWRRGVAVGIGFVPATPYAFVATGDLFAPRLGGRFVVGERAALIGAHTRPWIGASANAGLGGRVLAHPAVAGPPPSALRIAQSAVVHPGNNRGVMQARAFARPASGGSRAAFASSTVGQGSWRAPSQGFSERAVAPAYGSPAPSQYGGRFATGGSARASTTLSSSVPAYTAGAPRSFAAPAPAYRSGGAAPAFRSAPSAPAGHSFGGSAATGGFHSGGGYSGGFHASGGGGYHGGGGGGGSRGGGGHGGGRR